MNDVSLNRDNGKHAPLAARPSLEGMTAPADQPGVPRLMQYLRIATRWKWLILGSIAISLLLGIIITLLATPLYTSTTVLEISREGVRVVDMDDVEPETRTGDMEFYQTQYGLLRSRALAERVARQLRLSENTEFFEMFSESEELEGMATRAGGNAAGARYLRLRKATEILLRNVAVSPTRLSRLVDISFTSPDPAFSALVANAWATEFIESSLERRFEATSYARRFLEDRLAQLRRRLEESERQLVGYASNQSIINIPVPGADIAGRPQERSLTADSLAQLNSALSEATAERVRAESRARSGGGAAPEALSNQAISLMRQRRAEAAAEHSRLLTQFEPGYPAVQALAAQIRQLDQSIAREEGRVQSTIQNAYRDSLQRERTLAARLEGLKQEFLDQRRRGIQYNIFQREVDTNRELYNGLLQRYKEIGVAGGVGANNISIVDRAEPAEQPSRPRPLINLLLALLVGSVVGVGLALGREQIDETIADPSDLEQKMGLPFLGAIPRTDSEDVVAEIHDPKSSLIEAYLSVQTNLAFSTDHGIPKTLAVTSTRPGEGKSTTAYAIAFSISRGGAKTLLIDGDMRSPSVHNEVGLRNEKGLSNFLAGTSQLDTLVQHTDREPFAILTAGPQPPNAADLLRSERLPLLLSELLTKYDHVVIDSPPVMGLADAPILASRVEATVFVLEVHGVTARVARLALNRLRQARAHLLGVVLTKFEAKRAHYGYGYEYGYGYGEREKATD